VNGTVLHFANIHHVMVTIETNENTDKNNSVRQHYDLAMRYHYGVGVQQDCKEALKNFLIAGEAGHAESQYLLGEYYNEGYGNTEINMPLAVQWYEKAATQGHGDAQATLGVCYVYGEGVKKNIKKGRDLIRCGMEKGSVVGLVHAALQLISGKFLLPNYKKAVRLLQGAVEKRGLGVAVAQLILGIFYREGRGIVRNLDKATELLTVAVEEITSEAQKGSCSGQYVLGMCYLHGWGVLEDAAEAVKWFHIVADRGDTTSQIELGECYLNGVGVSRNVSEAIKWFQKAAEKGDAKTKVQLAHCYLKKAGSFKYSIRGGCGILAISTILIPVVVKLTELLERFNITVIDQTVCLIIAAICLVVAGVGAYFSWKESSSVRVVVSPFLLLLRMLLSLLRMFPNFLLGIGILVCSAAWIDILGLASFLCIVTLFFWLFVAQRRVVKIACVIVFLISASTISIIKIEQCEIDYTPQTVWEVARWEVPQWEWSIMFGWRQHRNLEMPWREKRYMLEEGYNRELDRLGGSLVPFDTPYYCRKLRSTDNDEERHLCELLYPYYAPFSDISPDDISEEQIKHLWTEVWTAYEDSLPHEKQVILHAPNSTGVQTILGRERDNHLREQLSHFWYPFLWEERIIFYHRKGSIVSGTDEAERLYEQLFNSLLGQMRPKIGKSSYRWFVFGIPVHSYEVRFLTYYVWNGKHEPAIGLFKK